MQRYLYIHLDHLHIRTNRQIIDEYFSFLWQDCFYFSNTYSHLQLVNYSIPMNHSILIPIEEPLLENILMQVWENHMIVFEHSVDISELNTRNATRKKLETRQGQILQYSVQLFSANQVIMAVSPNSSILQHFMILENFKAHENSLDTGPSFFKIQFSEGEIIVPVSNISIMIPVPTKMKFWHIKNGKNLSRSKFYESQDIKSSQFRSQMISKEDNGYDLDIKVRWVTILGRNSQQINALLGAHDILLSDIELRFEPKEGQKSHKVDLRPQHVAGTKLKVTTLNKAFQLNGDLDPYKATRFGRIVYFIVKSQEEDFTFTLQKGTRIIAKTTIGTDQLLSYHPNVLKKKLLDPFTGKAVANVKFRGEKAKNLSLPQNNKFWKHCTQNKIPAMMLQFSQLSLWGIGHSCGVVIKSEQEQFLVSEVPDLNIFKLQTEVPEPVQMAIRQEGNVFMKLVSTDGNESLGMANLNPKDLRLGAVPIVLPFYKQKDLVCEARMIVNKVMPWQFVKGTFQPESLIGSGVKSMSLSVTLKSIELTSYYWSFLYEGKSDFYCIFELNRVKKVVILERVTSTEKLLFLSAAGSDLLNFVVERQESFKVKFTVLASDQGVQQQIYGTSQKRVILENIEEGPAIFRQQPISNGLNLQVGQIDFQVQKGLIGEFKKVPVKQQLSLVRKDLQKINKSIQRVEKKIGSPKQRNNKQFKSQKRYDSLVLPEIKDPKQERLKRLAKALQAKPPRRKQTKGLLTSRDEQSSQKVALVKNRVRSQGISGLKQSQRYEFEQLLPPIPLPVRQEDYLDKISELKIELPSGELQQNQFAQSIRYDDFMQ